MLFGDKVMRQFLTPEAYKAVKVGRRGGKNRPKKLPIILHWESKEWALSKGVTHYNALVPTLTEPPLKSMML